MEISSFWANPLSDNNNKIWTRYKNDSWKVAETDQRVGNWGESHLEEGNSASLISHVLPFFFFAWRQPLVSTMCRVAKTQMEKPQSCWLGKSENNVWVPTAGKWVWKSKRKKKTREGASPNSSYELCSNLWLTLEICMCTADSKQPN